MQDLLLTIHILAVAVWFGGSIMNGYLNMRVEATDNVEANATLARVETKLGMAIYMPASILTLLTGIGLVLVVDGWEFSQAFVSIGFLAVIVAAVLGPVKFMPLSEKIAAAWEAGDPAAAKAASKEIAMWSAINSGLLLVAIVAMVYKPGA